MTPDEQDAWVQLLLANNLGEYSLDRALGNGNFGFVFEATNTQTNAKVAIKVLQPNSGTQAGLEFENEGLLLRKLNSCNGVVSYIDGGQETILVQSQLISVPMAISYHVLNLASGSIDEIVSDPNRRGRLSWIEKLQFFRDAVVAVRQMHKNGVVHRDLKCSNCLMMVNGNNTIIKLADLGRSKDLSIDPTAPPNGYLPGKGDMRFAPPEFLYLQGGTAPTDFLAADYHGLGSLLAELATGQGFTSLVFPNIQDVLRASQKDLVVGVRRDLSGLLPKYQAMQRDVASLLPPTIQEDAATILFHLTHPVPSQRMIRPPYGRDRRSKEPLDWVLRRIDIMIRRLDIEARTSRKVNQKDRISA